MTTTMDELFAAALRDVLVEQVQTAGNPSRGSGRSRRWIVRAGVVLVLAAGGGGIAYATGAWTTPPGGNQITDLSSPVTATGTGTKTVDLGPPPRGATAINISFICLTAGHFTFADGAAFSATRPTPPGSRVRSPTQCRSPATAIAPRSPPRPTLAGVWSRPTPR